MTKEEFIEVLKKVVVDGSVDDMESNLTDPPGRSPAPDLKELSTWFNAANEKDKSNILAVIKKSVDMSIFGFLCILDGVRAIKDGPEKGKLNLLYINEKTNEKVLINSDEGHYLHELF